MKEQQAMEFIEEAGRYGIVPGLEGIKELCRRLGDPQKELSFVHIAGTNGKGSALAYISTVLKCAGYQAGRYISPVIFGYRERIQVRERPITKAALCEGMELIKGICESMTKDGLPHPTPFEIETALAFWYFQRKKCDIVVLETGMGGAQDATNLIEDTLVAVIASIGMDHMNFLGNTLEEIAAQKAGIIKPGCAVVTMKQQEEVMRVLEETAGRKGCVLKTADSAQASRVHYGLERQLFDYGEWKRLEISLAGPFQVDNAVLAIEALRTLVQKGYPIPERALRQGMVQAVWPGRFQVISSKPLFIVDGAHNEDAARKLARSIEFYFTNRRIIYIIGILRDKEAEKILQITQAFADHIITVTPPQNPRAMSAYELAAEAAALHERVTAVDSLEEAVEMSRLLAGREDVIIAFGSLSYLGRLIQIVQDGK